MACRAFSARQPLTQTGFELSDQHDNTLDTSAARAEILGRIRAFQGRQSHQKGAEEALVEQVLRACARGPMPKQVADVAGLFVERAKAMLCTVACVPDAQAAVREVASYLAQNKLTGTVAVWPALEEAFRPHGLLSALNTVEGCQSRLGAPQGSDLIGLSGVACAVAETGTLCFASNSAEPASTHLLPETHIALVYADQIVHTMEHAFERLREQGRQAPRALNFVSGPSRTADIEQTIVLGAHGPYRVHVVVIEGASGGANGQ